MQTIIIFWHVFFLVVGFLVGILVGRRIERGSAPRAPKTVPDSQPAPAVDSTRLKAGRGPGGKVWLELDGKQLQTGQTLDPEQQHDLSSLVMELRPWLPMETPVRPAAPLAPAPAAAGPVAPVPPKPAKAGPPTEPVMKSMIQQINDVLQARLNASPFKDRGIELVEGPGGSVVVVDGSQKFEGIDSVPDANVQALIRESVAEWEKNAR